MHVVFVGGDASKSMELLSDLKSLVYTHLNYLARAVSTHCLSRASKLHDSLTRSTFMAITGLSPMNDDQGSSQSTLKIRLGVLVLGQQSRYCVQRMLTAAQCDLLVQDCPMAFST